MLDVVRSYNFVIIIIIRNKYKQLQIHLMIMIKTPDHVASQYVS